LRTPLIIALAATLVGCSRQPPHQAAAEFCTGKQGFACSNRTAAGQPVKLASFKTNPPTRQARLTRAPLANKTAKPSVIAAKAELSATPLPIPPPSLKTKLEPESSAAAAAGPTGPNISNSPPTVRPAPNSNGRTIPEQVAAATVVAERMTAATLAASRDGAERATGASPGNTDLLVAVVMVRPEIRSVSDLIDKAIAIDDRYSASSTDVSVAIAAAGGPVVQLDAGRTRAVDRLVNGEVSAAVLALVSADAAEGFPEIAGFRTFRIPLSPLSLKARP
jgi:hypothetical protein